METNTNSQEASVATAESTIVSANLKQCRVSLLGGKFDLSCALTFPEEEIQPLFSGGCWAGTVVWKASLSLCDYLFANVNLDGKTVVELGAGVGVPGMCASLLGGKVLITEQDPLHNLIRKNVESNFKDRPNMPSVGEIDWLADDNSLDYHVDYILVSDCIYEHLYGTSWKALADCIKKLSTPGKTKTLNYVERRNDDGVDKYITYSKNIGFEVSKLVSRSCPTGEDLELYELVLQSSD
mmetsp:Transcript_11725/g.13487  ORF Transcript_11725/g.13487 Transcript_11725/m.13487 type:complete len:239 (+) Transcript_11725:60-776(+)